MAESEAPGLDFIVRRDDWSRCRFVDQPPPAAPSGGQVLFRVDRFAFTANNISYAMAGDMLRYWDFFPAAEEGWGRIPTMGFGDVVRSAHPDVKEGERCFGFYPMSRYLVIEPAGVHGLQIVDGAAHRQGLAPAYNAYTRVVGDPNYSAAHEDQLLLLRGLFMTSWLVDDFLGEQDRFGAAAVVIASASSKTAIALAHLLHRAGNVRVVGLTSPGNAAFVRGLGSYDDVVLYDDVETIPADVPSVLVDMSGNGPVVSRFHRHLGDNVKYSCTVGATHWDAGQRDEGLPGAQPEFFFAPAQIVKRTKEWGAEGFQERLGASWRDFLGATDSWLKVVRGSGRAAVESVYRETLAGRAKPSEGHVISLWDE